MGFKIVYDILCSLEVGHDPKKAPMKNLEDIEHLNHVTFGTKLHKGMCLHHQLRRLF